MFGASVSSRTSNSARASKSHSSPTSGNTFPRGCGLCRPGSATSTSIPSEPPTRSTRHISCSNSSFSLTVHKTPTHQATSNPPSANGRRPPVAQTAVRPKIRRSARHASSIGSTSTGRTPYSSAAHADAPPTPAPTSTIDTEGPTPHARANHSSNPGSPLPGTRRQPRTHPPTPPRHRRSTPQPPQLNLEPTISPPTHNPQVPTPTPRRV